MPSQKNQDENATYEKDSNTPKPSPSCEDANSSGNPSNSPPKSNRGTAAVSSREAPGRIFAVFCFLPNVDPLPGPALFLKRFWKNFQRSLKPPEFGYTMDIHRSDKRRYINMQKTLTRHGNSLALVIDRPILDLLKIDPETPLEITTNGDALVIVPVRDNPEKFREALNKVNRRYGKVLKKLAE